MRRLGPWALAVATALAALPAPAAGAGPAYPWCIEIPYRVTFVGLGPSGPDSSSGHFTVRVCDLQQLPIPGSHVWLDFGSCRDIAIARDQRDPRLTVNCAARTVSATTDDNGVARFTILGTGTAGPPSPGGSARVYADGVLLGPTQVVVLDRDGVDGLTLADLALWAADYFGGLEPERANLCDSPRVDLADLSCWAAAYFSGNDTQSAGPYCP